MWFSARKFIIIIQCPDKSLLKFCAWPSWFVQTSSRSNGNRSNVLRWNICNNYIKSKHPKIFKSNTICNLTRFIEEWPIKLILLEDFISIRKLMDVLIIFLRQKISHLCLAHSTKMHYHWRYKMKILNDLRSWFYSIKREKLHSAWETL